MTFKRFAFAYTLVFVLFFSASAQTPQVSTVNVTPDEQKVRVAAVGDVLEMRVAVSDESGDVVFESGPVADNKLDWTMKDPQGQRVPAGSYSLTVTYRMPNGKLKRRVEQVFVTEEVKGDAEAQAASDPTPQAVGTITGQGTTGKIAKFTGTNAIGNSVLTESSGRIGLGTTAPLQSLHAVGPSSRLRLQSTNGPALTTTEYVTNGRVWQSGAGGSTALNGVANKFFVYDQTANQYRLVIDTVGNFGIGTTAPASKLTVNGGIQILGAGNGIRFPDGSIQTKATAGTITGTGTTNRLTKFTGPNSFGNSSITEVSGRVGIGTTAPQSPLDVRALGYGLTHTDGGITVGTYVEDGGWFGTRSNHPLHFFTNNGGPMMTIDTSGKVGVGTTAPSARLDVVTATGTGIKVVAGATGIEAYNSVNPNSGYGASAVLGSSPNIGVTGETGDGTGVNGITMNGVAIQGFVRSGGTGYAGLFDGKLRVNGTFENNSDRNMKANIAAIEPRSILRKVAALPIHSWNYKAEPTSYRHLGPMAQDFRSAFGLGTGDTTISVVDADGVALASIQALYQQNQELTRTVERLQARLARVERTMRKKRTARGR